jgi:hypothetical protein
MMEEMKLFIDEYDKECRKIIVARGIEILSGTRLEKEYTTVDTKRGTTKARPEIGPGIFERIPAPETIPSQQWQDKAIAWKLEHKHRGYHRFVCLLDKSCEHIQIDLKQLVALLAEGIDIIACIGHRKDWSEYFYHELSMGECLRDDWLE